MDRINNALKASMQFYARTLDPDNRGWNILEIDNAVIREFYEEFGVGNNYKALKSKQDMEETIPYESWDLVIWSMTISQTWEYKEALTECFKYLKPGGHFVITCPFVLEYGKETEDYWRLSPLALSRLLGEIGFDHGRSAMWDEVLTTAMVRKPKKV